MERHLNLEGKLMNKELIKVGLTLLSVVFCASIALAEEKPKDPKPTETPAEPTGSECHGA
jgi:hypothetical protein